MSKLPFVDAGVLIAAARPTRNGLRRHPDLPRVWVSNEFLSTDEV
jgi:hypothetical protein